MIAAAPGRMSRDGADPATFLDVPEGPLEREYPISAGEALQ